MEYLEGAACRHAVCSQRASPQIGPEHFFGEPKFCESCLTRVVTVETRDPGRSKLTLDCPVIHDRGSRAAGTGNCVGVAALSYCKGNC
jgi:hypothetical protein